MALRALLISMIVVAPALGDDHMVGDTAGWNAGINFTLWAQENHFRVGDSLMFMYTPEFHNVIKVNASEFKTCTYSNETSKLIFTSGSDTIALASPGKKWYISGVGDDCMAAGMKLVITVSVAEGPFPFPMPPGSSTPPPATSAAAAQVSPLKSFVWAVVVMAAYIIMS